MIHEGAVLCVLCEFHKQECTFVQDPQPRKRKVPGEGEKPKEGSPKKRYVVAKGRKKKKERKGKEKVKWK